MLIREYGTSGPFVVAVHGGPGAAGYLAPVARQLADSFRVLEPFQRSSGGLPLTVAQHVADLQTVVETRCENTRPALVGHSWGAMLALAYAAAHPDRLSALVLVGCGTFDRTARAQMRETRDRRLDDDSRRRIERLPQEVADPNDRFGIMANLMLQLDSYHLISAESDPSTCDVVAHQQSWDDMVRLQDAGVYPAAFAAIAVPVLMLHGTADPHPGQMIRAGLAPHLPQLEYREWARCGHHPWLEQDVREEFYECLRGWLMRRMTEPPRCRHPHEDRHEAAKGPIT
jgi:pimeloyl-ACP methyl ester carboxylesterase